MRCFLTAACTSMMKKGYTPQCAPRFYATTGCFAEYVRRWCLDARFGCCVVTNCMNELDLIDKSGSFADGWGAEMTEIDKWTQGENMRTMHTLSIGGESGSGKTRAALRCANCCLWSKNGLKREDILTVYIKVSRENTEHWNVELEERDDFTKKAMKTMKDIWEKRKEYRDSFDTYRCNAFLEACIQDPASCNKHDLQYLRAALCRDWLCGVIKRVTKFQGRLGSNHPFRIAFIVLDEVASCPWIYRAVNGNSTDGDYIPKHFWDDTSFAKKYRFICVSTATEPIFRTFCTTPGIFNPVIMKSSSTLYEELVKTSYFGNRKNFFGPFTRNECFARIIQNRYCAVLAVNAMDTLSRNVTHVACAAAAMCQSLTKEEELALCNLSDDESAYAAAGFLVCLVSSQYNEAKGLNPNESKEMVAKGIRAFLCCEESDLEMPFSMFPRNPLQLGLFNRTKTQWRRDCQTVGISVSAAQQVMAATGYGSQGLWMTTVTDNPFGVFSAAVFSLFMSGYSTDCFKREDGKTIVLSSDAELSTFLNSVSATKVKCTYTNLLNHKSVGEVLFSPHQKAESGSLGSYWSALAESLGGEDNEQALVLLSKSKHPYADVIAKSGDILFLIHCEGDAEATKMNVPGELEKMGFSGSDNPEVDAFVETLDMNGPNLEEQLDHFMDKSASGKGKSGSDTTAESLPLLRGKLLTRLLMKALGCNIAVPVLMCSEPDDAKKKTKSVKCVENIPVQSFGWSDPPVLLFVGGDIERSTEISV
ncbi:hypothetical protein AGDE_16697 [Angomonas deanei]|nr:hypothetical protein AGDE_16697 [Angomonas deanei]|eukprot:EPY16587.1 hypothetical protein AGDE_16697 [Angomonas deanei]